MKNRFVIALMSLLALLACFPVVAGENYPRKPITVINPFNPGGGADLILRPFEAVAKKYIDQSIVIVYKEGAGGVIGTAEVARARADGYTIGLAMSGPLSTQPALTTVPYDPANAFDFIGGLVFDPNVIAVRAEAPYKTLSEFVAAAKTGDFTYSSPATGSVGHLAAELFLAQNGVAARHVPSASGGREAVTNLLGGHIDFVSVNPSEVHAGYLAGDIRILGVMAEKRRAQIPEVPTFRELGYDYVEGVLRAFIAPKGLPADVADALNALLVKVLADAEFLQAMDRASVEIDYMTPEAVKKRYIDDYHKFSEVVKKIGLR